MESGWDCEGKFESANDFPSAFKEKCRHENRTHSSQITLRIGSCQSTEQRASRSWHSCIPQQMYLSIPPGRIISLPQTLRPSPAERRSSPSAPEAARKFRMPAAEVWWTATIWTHWKSRFFTSARRIRFHRKPA